MTPSAEWARVGDIRTVGWCCTRRDAREAIDGILRWAADRGVDVVGLPDEVARIDASATAVPRRRSGEAQRSHREPRWRWHDAARHAPDHRQRRTGPRRQLGRPRFLAEVDVPIFPPPSELSTPTTTASRDAPLWRLASSGTASLAFNDIALIRVPGTAAQPSDARRGTALRAVRGGRGRRLNPDRIDCVPVRRRQDLSSPRVRRGCSSSRSRRTLRSTARCS